MNEKVVDGEHKAEDANSWATVWVKGELSDLSTFEKVTGYLGKNVKDPNGAKVFQGMDEGEPSVYIVFRQ